MNKNRPNDRNGDRRKGPYDYESNDPLWYEIILDKTKKFFISIKDLFIVGYRKYDAFIRRLFKLPPVDYNNNNYEENYDDLKDLAQTRRIPRATEPNEQDRYKNQLGNDDTQDFNYMPSYLKQKQVLEQPEKHKTKRVNRIAKTHDNHDEHVDEHGHPISIFKKRQRPRNFAISVLLGVVKITIALILILGLSGLGVIQGIANAYVNTTPELDITKIENQDQTSFIFDGNGDLITDFIGLENRISASIDEIPEMLQYAFIAIEDERFYTHKGVDIKRIIGAFFNNIRTDTTHGGSTITQQLIKLRILSREQTYKRKLQEAYLATELEKEYTKDQILEAYMNTIDLGSGNYGVKAAAKDYFNKELNQLTLRECAMIAGIANSPYLFNPRLNFYRRQNQAKSDERTDKVLKNMYRTGYISKAEYEDALNQTVFVAEESKKRQMYDMPYFLEYAIHDVVSHFIRQRNLDDNSTNRAKIENELRTSGYYIYTTVDPKLQHIVEDSLYNWQKYPPTKYESDANVIVKNNDGSSQEIIQPQAAAVVFDYHTGELKAIVGGRNEPTVKKGLNRAYQSHMSVGSSIKPLAVYGPALNMGVPPSEVILDIPVQINGWNDGKGYPNNYGGTFSGPLTMREGMYRSVNVVASTVLADYVTLDESYRTMEALGINSSYINKDLSGLALGTSGISVLEMAVAYGAVGNNGTYREPISFTQVVDSKGNVLLDASSSSMQITRPVFKPWASWLLVDMMKDVVKRGTGGKAKIKGMTVAGKTGTNSKYRGVYFSGLTPYYSAAIWVGHDNNKPLYTGAQGGRDAAPLWSDFMSKIHHELDLENKAIIPDSPESLGLVKQYTCPISGKLLTDECKNDPNYKPVYDYVHESNRQTEKCDLHITERICIETHKLATTYCPQSDPYSFIRIPEDSIIHELSDEDFKKYFPTGIKGYDPATLNINNPLYADMYCPIHTQEWYENKQKLDKSISLSNNLIKEVEYILINYSEHIGDDVKTMSNNKVAELKETIKTQDYVLINRVYQELQTIKQTYLDPIVATYPIDPKTPEE